MEAGNASRSGAAIVPTIVITTALSGRLVSGRGPPVPWEEIVGSLARVPPRDQGRGRTVPPAGRAPRPPSDTPAKQQARSPAGQE